LRNLPSAGNLVVEKSIMDDKSVVRQQVWEELRKVARPDSRFHWDFGEFIPDYDGSEQCAQAIRQLESYRRSSIVFITPDNNLLVLRQYAINDGKTILMASYGIARGFMRLDRRGVPHGQERYAASLDGMEEYAIPVGVKDLSHFDKIDLLVTGASIITPQGVRWGKGHGYFDLEWAMFRELRLVDEDTPVVAVAHDCQVVELELTPEPYDTIVDHIVTPTRTIDTSRTLPKPQGILWDKLDPAMLEKIPPLNELHHRKKNRFS
jgi:5-formyltetrahydrofolate cyclo-ligase